MTNPTPPPDLTAAAERLAPLLTRRHVEDIRKIATPPQASPYGHGPSLVILDLCHLAEALFSQVAAHERAHAEAIQQLTNELEIQRQFTTQAETLYVAGKEKLAERDAEIQRLREALRLLLRFHSSTEHPRWGEWAGRLFDDPDEDDVSVREVEQALGRIGGTADAD